MKCKINGCENEAHTRGMCKLHYGRWIRTGKTEVSRPCLRGTIEEKFNRYVDKTGNCWKWTGYKDKDGYGKMRVGNSNMGAHRVSFFIQHGRWPEKMILHKCNNPGCVNPDHLYEGDHKQNMSDRKKSGHYPCNENSPVCKYPDSVVIEILASNQPPSYFNQKYGISVSQVKNIRRREQRKIES